MKIFFMRSTSTLFRFYSSTCLNQKCAFSMNVTEKSLRNTTRTFSLFYFQKGKGDWSEKGNRKREENKSQIVYFGVEGDYDVVVVVIAVEGLMIISIVIFSILGLGEGRAKLSLSYLV